MAFNPFSSIAPRKKNPFEQYGGIEDNYAYDADEVYGEDPSQSQVTKTLLHGKLEPYVPPPVKSHTPIPEPVRSHTIGPSDEEPSRWMRDVMSGVGKSVVGGIYDMSQGIPGAINQLTGNLSPAQQRFEQWRQPENKNQFASGLLTDVLTPGPGELATGAKLGAKLGGKALFGGAAGILGTPSEINSAYLANSAFNTPRKRMSTFGVGPSDVALRQMATDKTMKQLEEHIRTANIPYHEAQKIREIAKKYPRVMAHQNIFTATPLHPDYSPNTAGASSSGMPSISGKSGKSVMELSTKSKFTPFSANTFVHELMHGAQRLALREHATAAFGAANDALRRQGLSPKEAYFANPIEVGARRAAEKRVGTNKAYRKEISEPPVDPNSPSVLELFRALGIDPKKVTWP